MPRASSKTDGWRDVAPPTNGAQWRAYSDACVVALTTRTGEEEDVEWVPTAMPPSVREDAYVDDVAPRLIEELCVPRAWRCVVCDTTVPFRDARPFVGNPFSHRGLVATCGERCGISFLSGSSTKHP